MADSSGFYQRIVPLLQRAGIDTRTQTDIAAALAVSSTMVRKYKDGASPHMKNVIEWALRLGVCVEWLLTGRGPKYPHGTWPPEVQEIADKWPYLPAHIQMSITTIVRASMPNLPATTPDSGAPATKTRPDDPIQ